jgi:hypothetical protein
MLVSRQKSVAWQVEPLFYAGIALMSLQRVATAMKAETGIDALRSIVIKDC